MDTNFSLDIRMDPIRMKDSTGKIYVDNYLIMENCFTLAFSVELFIKIMSYKKFSFFLTDPVLMYWNWLDILLVSTIVTENWILSIVLSGQDTPLGALSAMRLLRLARISRIVHLIPELGIMVRAGSGRWSWGSW